MNNNINKKEKRIGHYKSSQMILLVGEGDFSFSACLAKAFRYANNMVATSLDSLDTLLLKYGSFEAHWKELKSRDCLMLHEVDVHDMNIHPTLSCMSFDVIIFNFPHAGHTHWLCETDHILIQRHKNLVRGFFRSARGMLKKGGEIHVAHRDDEPYCQWELEKLAQECDLFLKEKVAFVKQHYPGYHNKRGGYIQGNKTFPFDQNPFTFKFQVREVQKTCGEENIVEFKEDRSESNCERIDDDRREIVVISENVTIDDDQSMDKDDNCEKISVCCEGDGENLMVDVDDNGEGDCGDVRVKLGILALFMGCLW